MRLRLVPEDTNINFFKSAQMALGASLLVMAVSILLFFLQGLNFGIDFRGGTHHSHRQCPARKCGAISRRRGRARIG